MATPTYMNELKIERGKRVDLKEPDGDIIAFQLVVFHIGFYGSKTTSSLDTKILSDGRQLVIDGCGLIPAGTNISEMK